MNDLMEQRDKKEKMGCWAYALFMVVLTGVCSIFQPLYTNVDNYIISLILNRVYDSDTYCMFLNPVLCWISTAAGQLIPDADGFTLLTRIMILIGVGSISYFIAEYFRGLYQRCFFGIMTFFLATKMELFSDYFMVWAAFFSFVGMVWLLAAMREDRKKSSVLVGTVFLCCGVMWRIEAAILFIPFMMLDLTAGLLMGWGHKWTYLKKMCRVIGPAFICVCLLLGMDYGYKHSEKYEDSVNFCDAVSTVGDFPMRNYEEVKELIPDVTSNDYSSLEEHFYADTERITTQYCEAIAEAGKMNAEAYSIKGTLKLSYTTLTRIYDATDLRVWSIILFFAAIFVFVSEIKWGSKIELVCVFGGAYLIVLYLAYGGRLPERILQSILYAISGMILVMLISVKENPSCKAWKYGGRIGMFALAFFVILNISSCNISKAQSVFAVRNNVDETKWADTYVEDTIYIWQSSMYRRYPMADFMSQGKLFTEKFFAHNICVGGWDFNQVFHKNYLYNLGIQNPVQALLQRKHTYYVGEDYNSVWIYLKEHYDETVRAEQIGEIDGIPVWKFVTEKT